ncbi:MAG: signal peptide peptidase SppA [Calditrichaeota bacterium]|nr:MAG: signal peptide peptidase SppA [Calditrichota bacterium]
MIKRQDKIFGLFILAGAIFLILLLLVMLRGMRSDSNLQFSGGTDKVALVELNGVITSSRSIVRQFEQYRKDQSIKAIVFRIESPGGGIAASQEIYEHVRRTRDAGKPVIASMGSVAASGGYYVALGADSIMANPGTTTGSIGVIAEFPNLTKLLDKLGIQMTVIKSGPLKDTGSPYREVTDRDRQYLQEWINSGYDQFIQVVARERNQDINHVRKLADGRVYSGQQAYNLALIDTLGTFEDAIALAAAAAGIKGEPRIIRQERRKTTPFDLLFTFDVKEFLETYFSAWPRVQYMLTI